MDVKTAFLNGELEEEICIIQPSHFVHPDYPDYVCLSLRALNGLKQSPQQWNARFHSFMRSIHFRHLHTDVSVYVCQSGSHYVILALYVDDIILLATSLPTTMNQIKGELTASQKASSRSLIPSYISIVGHHHRLYDKTNTLN